MKDPSKVKINLKKVLTTHEVWREGWEGVEYAVGRHGFFEQDDASTFLWFAPVLENVALKQK